MVICDRYYHASMAYQGYGRGIPLDLIQKLTDLVCHPFRPDLTFLLDIAPEVSAKRKTADRDRYERDLALLGRVRNSYLRLAEKGGWTRLSADRDRALVAVDIWAAVERRL